MRNRLLAFGSFADDAKRILTAVHWLALMSIKSRPDLEFSIAQRGAAGLELRIAPFTNANHGDGALDESQIALCHASSLAQMPNLVPVDFKRHHYLLVQ